MQSAFVHVVSSLNFIFYFAVIFRVVFQLGTEELLDNYTKTETTQEYMTGPLYVTFHSTTTVGGNLYRIVHLHVLKGSGALVDLVLKPLAYCSFTCVKMFLRIGRLDVNMLRLLIALSRTSRRDIVAPRAQGACGFPQL